MVSLVIHQLHETLHKVAGRFAEDVPLFQKPFALALTRVNETQENSRLSGKKKTNKTGRQVARCDK
jgi:hypothetical protein